MINIAEIKLTDKEIEHIDDWPNDQKEDVRKILVKAVDDELEVDFFWELHRGQKEYTEIDYPDGSGGVTITFFSPWNNVSEPDEQTGEIVVSVG